MNIRIALLVLGTAWFTLSYVHASYNRVCYYTNWSQYRNGIGKFFPENIDTSLCTHLIYSFAFLNGNDLVTVEWNDESTPWMKGMYARFNDLKKKAPSIKTLLAVGGYTMGSLKFSQMVATDANINQFATNAITFLRKYGFDGLDIDWEYPGVGRGQSGDKQRLVQFVKILKDSFEQEASTTGNLRLLLSAALPAGKDKIDAGFDVPKFSKYVDMVNLMAYDYHGGSWEDHTGHNSPLYKSKQDFGPNAYLNVQWTADYYVKLGMPPSLINLGLALYGRSFTLRDVQNNGLYAPDVGNGGQAGKYTGEPGYLSYYEVCDMLQGGASRHFLSDQQVPYLVQGDQWVGYEDADSLRLKVDFAKQKGYGGIMIWALDTDDFTGHCGHGKFPLLHAINDELTSSKTIVVPTNPTSSMNVQQSTPATVTNGNHQTSICWIYCWKRSYTVGACPRRYNVCFQQYIQHIPVGTTKHMTVKTTVPSATTNPHVISQSNGLNCQGKTSGFYPDPLSCSSYYVCAASLGFKIKCSPGLLFKSKTRYCDYPNNVQCSTSNMTSLSPASSTALPVKLTTSQSPTTQKPKSTMAPSSNPLIISMLTSTTQPKGTSAMNAVTFCRGRPDGLYSNPNDCGLFYQCSSGLGFEEPCPPGLVFNDNLGACDYPYVIPNCMNYVYQGR